ncbi:MULTISPECIES: hypothetical protein [unclassified Streptomyces]|uniref:hypothetical protein n=1 Tax=unclassified Streptomyces TaxID=2593676 RepID=UPI003009B2B1
MLNSDRDTAVVGMVAWHHAVDTAAVSDRQTKSSSVSGFGSGNVTRESGTNRSYTTGSSSGRTTRDTWK